MSSNLHLSWTTGTSSPDDRKCLGGKLRLYSGNSLRRLCRSSKWRYLKTNYIRLVTSRKNVNPYYNEKRIQNYKYEHQLNDSRQMRHWDILVSSLSTFFWWTSSYYSDQSQQWNIQQKLLNRSSQCWPLTPASKISTHHPCITKLHDVKTIICYV